MQQSGYGRREMVSGAGHDPCYASKVVPTSMIFIPGIDGISHNEVEDAKSDWITAGEQVLLLSTLDKARGPGRVLAALLGKRVGGPSGVIEDEALVQMI